MPNQSLYANLTSRINELLGGELKKLTVGSKFIEKGVEFQIVMLGSFVSEELPYDVFANRTDGMRAPTLDTFASEYVKEECEIIPRDPSLADVLRAIEKLSNLPSGSWITVNDYLCFYEADTDNELVCLDMTKHLSGQSQETQEWLLELLK